MAKRNEIPALFLALGVTLGLVGGGYWWFTRHTDLGRNLSNSLPSLDPNSSGGIPGSSAPTERLSAGEKVLVTGVTSPDKLAGVQAIAAGNYPEAVARLEASLQQNRNDPEARIYLNNARIGSQPSYTLAVAAPTITAVDPAQEILRGVAQAQEALNQAGGVNGVPLRIVIVNDDNDPAVATQVAEALVADDAVLGVIGHFGSETSLAASAVYQPAGLVMVSPTSTSIQLSGVGNAVFRTVPSDRFTATALSRYLVNVIQQRNVALYFNGDSDYSRSLKNEVTTALYSDGGQVVAEFNVVESGFNAARSLDQATQQGAEAVALLTNTATLDQALQVLAANQTRLPVVGGDSLYNPRLLQQGAANAINMAVAVPWIFLSDPDAPFARDARQLWGGDVNWRTAMTYDATIALAEALEGTPTRAGVLSRLGDAGFSAEGATGQIRFLPSGDRNQAMQLVEVVPGSRSGFGYDFVPVQP